MSEKGIQNTNMPMTTRILMFVKKENEVVMILQQEGFQKVWTRYDHLPSEENFRRYEKTEELENNKFHRITIDFLKEMILKPLKLTDLL
jgi:hypothetical protein